MNVGVSRILELSCHKPPVRFGELTGFGDHAHPFICLRGQNDFGAQKAHELASLNRKRLDHDGDKRVTLGGTDHRQPNASIAGCGFDNGLTRGQLAALLSGLDDAHGEAVFD